MKKHAIIKAAKRHKASVIRKINKAVIDGSFIDMEPEGTDRKYIAWEEEDVAFIAGALWALKKAGIPVESNHQEEDKVKEYVDKALSKSTAVYFGCQTPSWIRSKLDAHPGDTTTVYGIPKRHSKKPPYNLVEGYAVIDRKRVYNGDHLCFDGNNWIILEAR